MQDYSAISRINNNLILNYCTGVELMKIGIIIDSYSETVLDGEVVQQNGGIGVYLKQLLEALLSVEANNEYYLIRSRPLSVPFITHPRVHYVQFPPEKLHFYARYSGLWREWVINRYKLDLIHEPAPTESALRFTTCPLVITVHDVIPLYFPEWFTFQTRLAFRLFSAANLKRAEAIISISENTKKDLLRFYPETEGKITVVPLASQLFDKSDPDPSILQKFGLRKPFILNVSTIEPRKNHIAMFEAMSILKERGYPHQLVCVGTRGWKTEKILEHPALQKYKDDIILAGLVDRKTLSHLYRQADLFLYPTLCEGFGIPPLEALGAGVPVLASANSSLPEVLGEAASYFGANPDGEEIAEGIIKLLADPSKMQGQVKTGYERWKLFNWEKTARNTLSVYEIVGRG